jgi:hypothetical protein
MRHRGSPTNQFAVTTDTLLGVVTPVIGGGVELPPPLGVEVVPPDPEHPANSPVIVAT